MIIYGFRKWKLTLRKAIITGTFGEFASIKNNAIPPMMLLGCIRRKEDETFRNLFPFPLQSNTPYRHSSHVEPDGGIENNIIYIYISLIKNTISGIPKGFQKDITHYIIIFIM